MGYGAQRGPPERSLYDFKILVKALFPWLSTAENILFQQHRSTELLIPASFASEPCSRLFQSLIFVEILGTENKPTISFDWCCY
jgi:hypothetical protein